MIDVGSVQDFEEGLPKVVDVEGREIGIVRWRGEFFAVRNRCPHMAARICSGGLVAPKIVGGTVGTLLADEDTPVLGCPWHGWQFELRTGSSVWDPNYRVTVFETETRGDRLYVATAPARSARAPQARNATNAET
jgi:nitrite reductase (NADH) small subunit